MNWWKGLIPGVCITSWILIVVFLVIPWIEERDSIYKGQEVFLTQQAYEDFKADVKDRVYEDNLGLKSFDVLASEPPIIVSFSVVVPYDYEFPYGESHFHDNDWLLIGMVSVFALVLLVVAPISLAYGY